MLSIEVLLDIIATEAIEGESKDSYFSNKPEYDKPQDKAELPHIRFDLELIKKRDGHYVWVE